MLPREDYIAGTHDHLTMAAAARLYPDAVVLLEHQLGDVLDRNGFRLRVVWPNKLIAEWVPDQATRERRIQQDAARMALRRGYLLGSPEHAADLLRRAALSYTSWATWVQRVGIWRRYHCEISCKPYQWRDWRDVASFVATGSPTGSRP